jgi:hypothetical protein
VVARLLTRRAEPSQSGSNVAGAGGGSGAENQHSPSRPSKSSALPRTTTYIGQSRRLFAVSGIDPVARPGVPAPLPARRFGRYAEASANIPAQPRGGPAQPAPKPAPQARPPPSDPRIPRRAASPLGGSARERPLAASVNPPLTKPIIGILGYSARATGGQVAAEPQRRVIPARRLIRSPRRRDRAVSSGRRSPTPWRS